MSTEPRIWYQDRDHAVATCGPLIVAHWRGAKTYNNWRMESNPVFRHVNTVSPAGSCVLIIAEENASTPDAAARKEVDELARERSHKVAASAIIAYGSTMRVTTVRTLAVAINIFGKSTMRVFTDAPTALSHLVDGGKRMQVAIDQARCLQLINDLRAGMATARSAG